MIASRVTTTLACLIVLVASCAARSSDPPAASSGAVLIVVRGPVDRVAVHGLRARLGEALSRSPQAIVFEIDTPVATDLDAPIVALGTEVRAARAAGVRTVAWIPGRALGYGALLALACGEITMAPEAAIGNAAPGVRRALSIEQMVQPASVIAELSGAIAEWSDDSVAFPARLGQAMVDPELEVSRVLTSQGFEYWTAFELANPPRPQRGVEERITAAGQALQLGAAQAREHRICQGLASSQAEMLERLGMEVTATLEPGAIEPFARLVARPWMTVLLIALGLLGIFIEAKTAGFGVGGTLAVLGFGTLFLGLYASGLAAGGEILLFVLGVLLLVVELFLLPGFGVAGFTGIALIVSSLFFVTLPETGAWRFGDAAFNRSLLMLMIAMVLPVIAMAGLVRVLPHTPLFGRLVLKSASPPAPASVDLRGVPLEALVGRLGTTVTVLRPAGRVQIDGEEHDAVSEGELIEAGAKVRVVAISGNEAVVRREPGGATAPA